MRHLSESLARGVTVQLHLSLFTGAAKANFCNMSFVPSEAAVLNLVLRKKRAYQACVALSSSVCD